MNVFQSLLPVVAGATQKNRLVRFAEKLGLRVIRQLTTIVAPSTLLGWIRAEKKGGTNAPEGTPVSIPVRSAAREHRR